MHNFKELSIWQKAVDLSIEIYRITKDFPDSEKFGLISQLRRASVSVPSNIAEGAGRNSDKEFIRFLGIANGSCFELQTQILIASRLDYIGHDVSKKILDNIEEIQRMSSGFQRKLQSNL